MRKAATHVKIDDHQIASLLRGRFAQADLRILWEAAADPLKRQGIFKKYHREPHRKQQKTNLPVYSPFSGRSNITLLMVHNEAKFAAKQLRVGATQERFKAAIGPS